MFVTRIDVARLFFCLTLLALFVVPAYGQTDKPEAYLRFEGPPEARSYYVAVYIKKAPAGGLDQIRASLRDTANKKLISTTIDSPPPRDDSRFIIRVALTEKDLFEQLAGYRVFVDSYPTAQVVEDHEISVALDVKVELAETSACPQDAIHVRQISNTQYGAARFSEIVRFLDRANVEQFITATVAKPSQPAEPQQISVLRTVRGVGENDLPMASACVELESAPPAGEYKLKLEFNASAPPELHRGAFEITRKGPDVPSATAEKRNLQDFLDLGLTLTSSVEDKEQPDNTTKRVRTTRGVTDLFFAPIPSLRTVDTRGADGGVVQILTPFYIDAKVSTGKITKDTLALNKIDMGFTYEFRHYLNTDEYPDVLRHALSFKHSSDRDFKQDEFKFAYEFQPSFGAVNQPRGSALILENGQPKRDENDKFGLEILPVLGVEIGRTYRVRDPKEFEGTSRNLRRFYFGGSMTFELTRYIRLSFKDLFYVRGENPKDRTENYFVGSVEAPIGMFGGDRAAHALFFSFERGEQPPFSNPSANVLKVGYRIRARRLIDF